MHYRSLLAAALLGFGFLYGLTVIDPAGQKRQWSMSDLTNENLQNYSILRNKDGGKINETWRGIEVNLWLKEEGYRGWHTIKATANDGYEIVLHRAELDTMTAFLGLNLNGEPLKEYELRLIFPYARETLWLRGVHTMALEPFSTHPPPQQVYIWEQRLVPLMAGNKELSWNTLAKQAFSVSKGTFILMDDEKRCISLDYPRILARADLSQTKDGSYHIGGIDLSDDIALDRLIYIQCGPYAYLRRKSVPQLSTIAKVLGWDWEKLKVSVISGKSDTFSEDIFNTSTEPQMWIELH